MGRNRAAHEPATADGALRGEELLHPPTCEDTAFPATVGQITIRALYRDGLLRPVGRRVSTFFGSQEMMVDVNKDMVTNPVAINVKPLPANRPASYANAVERSR